jgi:hypothetical protein
MCHYLRRPPARMPYDEYWAAGDPIASGVIEGACRQGVKDRRERAGMHWTLPGAQALLRLRGIALKGGGGGVHALPHPAGDGSALSAY